MRTSWAQGAAGALTAVVAVGLLLLPARVLGPEHRASRALELPTIAAAPAVQAAPAVRPRPYRPAPRPTPQSIPRADAAALASVVVTTRSRPSTPARRVNRHVETQHARLVAVLARQRRQRTTPDEARVSAAPVPAATPAPTAAPAPTVAAPTPTPAPAPAATPTRALAAVAPQVVAGGSDGKGSSDEHGKGHSDDHGDKHGDKHGDEHSSGGE